MLYRQSIVGFCLLSSLCSFNLWGNETDSINHNIDQTRESLVVSSRQGQAQRNEAIIQLWQLYKQSHNLLVRDDLIALLAQENRWQAMQQVCQHCAIGDYSPNELENLARAWRNLKQYDKAQAYYQRLYKLAPQNNNALLGQILVAIDRRQFATAQQLLQHYQSKFGQDKGYQSAYQYWQDSSEGDMAKLARWQQQLSQDPANLERAKQLYQLGAKYQLYPLQQQLLATYPQLFSLQDKLWHLEEKAVSSSRLNQDRNSLNKAYQDLLEVIKNTPEDSDLQLKALQDALVLAQKLEDNAFIEQTYSQLQARQALPNYVKESYGDYQLAQGSPFNALRIYQSLAEPYAKAQQPIPNNLLFKLFSAANDSGNFASAQAYLQQIRTTPYLYDFTRTKKIKNPDFDRHFFAQVYLQAWRGNHQAAEQLLDERLAKAPADIWAMLAQSELKQWQGYDDEALNWLNKMQPWLTPTPKDYAYIAYQKQRLAVALNQGDWRSASKAWQQLQLGANEQIGSDDVAGYETSRAAHLEISQSLSHKTYPTADKGNEFVQQYELYSPTSRNGHNLYLHYQASRSPNDQLVLKQGRYGVGTNINLYPLFLRAEAGQGTGLNKRGYAELALNYRFNQHWSFKLTGNSNSQTPVKAAYTSVYTKGGSAAIAYYAYGFNLNFGADILKFTDNNLRRYFYANGNLTWFKYDRWQINQSLSADYLKNNNIASAFYYNPLTAKNLTTALDIAYWQPLNYRLQLTHHLLTSAGYYWQQNQQNSRLWSISYEQQWHIAKQYALSIAVGRKKNIYDGAAEFNNFAHLGLSVYFY